MKQSTSMITGFAITAMISMPVAAGGASYHLSQALANSMEALAQTTVGGLKLISGSIALPLMMGGEIGKVSGQVGDELWEEANTPIGKPLVITDDIVTAGPAPAEAMKSKEEETK
ncbi:MAG: hypothetical protein HYY48_09850 [Gammaproteobacteria bacterium]|nr:hypothetical protein [Gammaproteobacteria bacterium]